LACLDSDLLYASDDYCLTSIDSTPHVHSVYNTAKLKGIADLQRQPHLLPMIETQHHRDNDKLMIFVDAHKPQNLITKFPLKAILLPSVTQTIEPRLERVSAGTALKALAPTSMLQLPGAAQQSFLHMGKLVRTLPCYRLEIGSDMKSLPGLILDLLAEHSSP